MGGIFCLLKNYYLNSGLTQCLDLTGLQTFVMFHFLFITYVVNISPSVLIANYISK